MFKVKIYISMIILIVWAKKKRYMRIFSHLERVQFRAVGGVPFIVHLLPFFQPVFRMGNGRAVTKPTKYLSPHKLANIFFY